MNSNGPVTVRLPESNQKMQDERKEIRDGVSGEGQGCSEEDESQIIESAELIDGRQMEFAQDKVHTPDAFQRSQKQCQGPPIYWERFLPLRSLKVLLVENDDLTRHVVSALLRNCGYEVTAVENGLQAWKIIEDLTTHMDLVLAEVVLPSLSGIGLLCKIMGHKTCKNIPVIMMSSYDSMNIVFKCLSKGAVDFLAKPIRKNELKNLWQHVWRKCHSSSDSGSESGIHSRKSTKLRSGESDINTGSNDEDDIGSIDLNVWDGSDDGSGTQTSWTKRAVEVESPLPVSVWEQLADPPDSTCAQVILSRPEAFGNNGVPVITPREVVGQDYELDLEIGIPRIPTLQLEDPRVKRLTNIPGTNAEKISEINSKKDEEKLKRGQLEVDCQKPNDDLRNKAGDLTGLTTNTANPQRKSLVFDIPNGLSKEADIKNKAILDYKEMPSLEFSLKRLRDVGDTETSAHGRNVLRHSGLSAFSRYNATSMTHQASEGNFICCSPHDNSSEAAKTDSLQNFQSTSKSSRSDQHSNGSRNNNDMASTTTNVFTKQVAFSDKPTLNSTVRGLHSSSAFQPGQNCHISSPQSMIKGKTDATVACTILAQARDINQQIQVQHHHHHHHHHHHVHNMSQQQIANHDDLSLKNTLTKAPQHGSSSTLSAPLEGSACSWSMNGSALGSNNGSNGQNGTTDFNARVTNIESGNGVAGKGRLSGVIGVTSRSGVDADLVAPREAALNKFREKRKQRCFEKKVRYQSRKQLAEQRPRVRGQFVRQVVHRKESKDAHC